MIESNLLTFSRWRLEKKSILESKGFKVDLVDCEPTENTARRMDIENGFLIATICVWERGYVEFDAIDGNKGATVLIDRADNELSLMDKLDYYLDVIIDK